LNSVKSFY